MLRTGEVLIALKTLGPNMAQPVCSMVQDMPDGGCEFTYCSQCFMSTVFPIREATVLHGLQELYAASDDAGVVT